MANRMLPLLYLNLGGEMMYILEQRLVAQNLGDKSSKGMFMKNAVIVYCLFLGILKPDISRPELLQQ